ncbi:hypothetical protein LSG31_16520 [Fodinisporobacter ferrooxydans]|uniref:Uncharacterized protein n=1 Tax=Fodinisporobacter ferrooxydans TaxID=2901836 RepID=A0ABY4CJ54_9BACL|nr:hypothetical protein LSG31_16520 [Alicyclobacillaceae bacterium MYW30-H2]
MGIQAIQALYRSLDVITVVLLLTGQITISGVFVTTEGGFSLSLAGPITGGARSVSNESTPNGNFVIDVIDVIAAFLLILDQINVIGTFVSAHRFTIVISGPPFGEPKRVAYLPATLRFFSSYRETVLQKCNVAIQKPRKK